MRIEIKDKGTKEFYKEVVSVMAQYPQLIRKPQMKYRDAFKSYRIMGIMYDRSLRNTAFAWLS